MSTRPSNSRRRANTETAVEYSRSNISPPAVFCPQPLSPMTPSANQGTSQLKRLSLPLPHPYQPYTPSTHHYHTASTTTPLQPESSMSPLSPNSSSANVDPADPKYMTVQHTYYVHHHYYNQPAPPQNPPQNPPPPSQGRAQVGWTLSRLITNSKLVRKYRCAIFFLLFLPLPPLLSVLYVVVGHSLLRRASSSPPGSYTAWSPSLISSANAAATGGTILSLPLFLALYIILPSSCRVQPRALTPRDDFFEDDDEEVGVGTLARVLDVAGYLACAIILICVGGAATALGVTCLAGGNVATGTGRRERRMLTAGRAAEAGIVGGAVLLAALLLSAVIGVMAWWTWMWMRRHRGAVEEEKS